MLKVLIADDEKDIVDLIAYLIKDLDVEIAGQATDGLSAYQLILEKEPDVVISDIRMPGMTGLELIEKVKRSLEKTEFIVISGYRDFEYAKTALQFGVQDYLLKPIKQEELARLLKRLNHKKDLDTKKQQEDENLQQKFVEQTSRIRREYLKKLLHGQHIDENTLALAGENAPICPVEGCLYQVLAIKLDFLEQDQVDFAAYASLLENMCEKYTTKLKSDSYDAEYFYEKSRGYIAFNYSLQFHQSAEQKKKYLQQLLKEDNEKYKVFNVTLGLGLPVREQRELPVSFGTALAAINNRILLGDKKIIEAAALSDRQLYSQAVIPVAIRQRIRKAIFELNAEQVVSCLDDLMRPYFHGESKEPWTIYQLSELWLDLIEEVVLENNLLDSETLPGKEDWIRRVNSCVSLGRCRQYLSDYVLKVMELCNDAQKSFEARPIREVKEYIEKNYAQKLSLEEIGKVVCLNPVYLSTLFKNQTGMTITNYMIKVRMEEAKRLLRETHMNVSSIAAKVGYTDTKFFSKTFMKQVGIKPVEYRKFEQK
ncbi:MAG: response regulator [Ruminococcus sp.]|jgi:two-component system response regulator YesN